MNRTDLALGYADVYWADDADAAWIASHGRTIRKRERQSAECQQARALMPITQRIRGWRRHGVPHGHTFAAWSTMREIEFRGQLHLAVLRGSQTAVRQLSAALVADEGTVP